MNPRRFPRNSAAAWRAAAVVIALAAGTGAFAQPSTEDVQIRPFPARDNITMLVGRGGNLAVSVGPDGVLLVDDQFPNMADKIRAAIATLGGGQVRMLVNTHWHGDHTGGNEIFGKSGAILVAHHNVRVRLSSDQVVEEFGQRFDASPAIALPVVTFENDVVLHWNGDTIHVRHVPSAHTDGDAIVHFVEDDVLHLGDVFFNGLYPFIDLGSGGSIDGVIAAVNLVLPECKETTKIIPGHGDLAGVAELRAYLEMLVAVRDRIAALASQGKSLTDVLAAKPTAEYDEHWSGGFMKPDVFIGIVYKGVSKPKGR